MSAEYPEHLQDQLSAAAHELYDRMLAVAGPPNSALVADRYAPTVVAAVAEVMAALDRAAKARQIRSCVHLKSLLAPQVALSWEPGIVRCIDCWGQARPYGFHAFGLDDAPCVFCADPAVGGFDFHNGHVLVVLAVCAGCRDQLTAEV